MYLHPYICIFYINIIILIVEHNPYIVNTQETNSPQHQFDYVSLLRVKRHHMIVVAISNRANRGEPQ